MGRSSDDYKGKNLGGTEELDKEDLIFSLALYTAIGGYVNTMNYKLHICVSFHISYHLQVNIYNLEAYITSVVDATIEYTRSLFLCNFFPNLIKNLNILTNINKNLVLV
ncbi:hypothetical protein ACJX0J_036529, partial [Zea mays]